MLGLAAGASSQERGVTADEVVLGTSMPLSGPAAYWGAAGRGMEAYARWINDQGGVHGRRLRVVARDDAYLPARAVTNVRELVEGVGVFAIVGMIGTANTFAVRDYLIESQVLWITPMADAGIWYGFRRKQNLFIAFPSFMEEGRILTEYAATRLGARTLAVFYQNDLYGQKGLLGAKRAAQALRLRIAAAVPYEVTDVELTSHALKIKESGAESVLMYATPRHGALIVRELAKAGHRPRLLGSQGLADPIMFRLAGEVWNDVIVASFIPMPESGDARVDAILANVVRYDPALRANPYNTAVGVAVMEPVVEALRRAGRSLTRERFILAMESLREWNGEAARRVTFDPDRRQGTNRIHLVRAEGERYVRLTDWIAYPTGF